MTYTTEQKIARRLIKAALANGWSVSVNDGEEWTVKKSTDFATIYNALQTTDEDTLRFRNGDEKIGDVWLIWGNGEDLISDNSDNETLNEFLKPIENWASELAE